MASTTSSRPSTRGSDKAAYTEHTAGRHTRRPEQGGSSYRKPMKRTSRTRQSQKESLPKANPSLLSVLSAGTGTSDRSSNSSSTVTPESYLRRNSQQSDRPDTQTRKEAELRTSATSQLPNVFDFMDQDGRDEGYDDGSVMSSSSSYQASDAGSSIAPDTPSSQSTFPSAASPTETRSHSVADLRRKYDPQYNASVYSGRSSSSSPIPSLRSLRKQPSVCDVPEEDEEDEDYPATQSEIDYERQRSSRSYEPAHQRHDSIHQHTAYEQHAHYISPTHTQHRSYSNSSAHSDRSNHAYNTALQHYQWPSPPPLPPPAMNGDVTAPPPAPDPPDLSHRTVTGYELLALELATPTSPIKPLYRKFTYLNHRILLHLQDELSELEEQLRGLDEIIAQMDSTLTDGGKSPASRRGENWNGTELHFRRRQLLGNVFLKTEQYNRAMAAFAALGKDAVPANPGEVEEYQRWMVERAPVCESEARFLRYQEDLVAPGAAGKGVVGRDKVVYGLGALMLPLVLFSVVPTLAGRMLVTGCIAVGGCVVATTTVVKEVMPARDWMVWGAVYVVLMAVIAGCMPGQCA